MTSDNVILYKQLLFYDIGENVVLPSVVNACSHKDVDAKSATSQKKEVNIIPKWPC